MMTNRAIPRVAILVATVAVLALTSSCSQLPKVEAAVTAACADFRRTEVQLAVAAASAAIPEVAELRSYGDRFCAEGAPAGDQTTAAQRTARLTDLTAKLAMAAAVAIR